WELRAGPLGNTALTSLCMCIMFLDSSRSMASGRILHQLPLHFASERMLVRVHAWNPCTQRLRH
ncbi:mCG146025, partial [Mus musculus]